MNWLHFISNNGIEVLIALVLANQSAQWFKVFRFLLERKKFNLSMLLASGGMPSSHTSTVVAMATSTGLVSGFSSNIFAVAVCLAIVVMYDATGVRRAAGKQAKVLNDIIQNMFSADQRFNKEKLKEFLGHTPKQVWVGAVLGIATSFILHYILIWAKPNL